MSDQQSAPQSVEQMMAAEMTARGYWTAEQATANLAAPDIEAPILNTAPAAASDVNADMAREMVKHGFWTQERADQFMSDLGAKPIDERQPVDELSAAAFEPPASPAAYRFEQIDGTTQDVEQMAMVKHAFHEAGVPAGIANQIAKLHDMAVLNPPSEADIQAASARTMAKLQATFGADTERYLAAANAEIQRVAVKYPQINTLIRQSGLGSNEFFVMSVINQVRARGKV